MHIIFTLTLHCCLDRPSKSHSNRSFGGSRITSTATFSASGTRRTPPYHYICSKLCHFGVIEFFSGCPFAIVLGHANRYWGFGARSGSDWVYPWRLPGSDGVYDNFILWYDYPSYRGKTTFHPQYIQLPSDMDYTSHNQPVCPPIWSRNKCMDGYCHHGSAHLLYGYGWRFVLPFHGIIELYL